MLALSALLGLVGSYWIGRSFLVDGKLRFGNPVASSSFDPYGGDLSDAQPRQVRAEITRVSAGSVVRQGDMCEFLIERRMRDPGSFYCNAQVVCGGRLLYGGPDRGYFACRLDRGERRDVVGSDPSTTSADQDAAFRIDTHEGIMRVWDDAQGPHGAFEVEAEVLSVH